MKKIKKNYKINNRHYLHIRIFIGYIWKAKVQTWFKIWIEVSNLEKKSENREKNLLRMGLFHVGPWRGNFSPNSIGAARLPAWRRRVGSPCQPLPQIARPRSLPSCASGTWVPSASFVSTTLPHVTECVFFRARTKRGEIGGAVEIRFSSCPHWRNPRGGWVRPGYKS